MPVTQTLAPTSTPKATPTWTRADIDNLLRTNDKAVVRAIIALYRLQTKDEQARQDTLHKNHVGFSAAHARRGTYYAQLALAGKPLYPKTLERARRIALRHSRQLVEIANTTPTPLPTSQPQPGAN